MTDPGLTGDSLVQFIAHRIRPCAVQPFQRLAAFLRNVRASELQQQNETSNWPSDWAQNIKLAFRLDTKHQTDLQTGHKTSNWPSDWTENITLASTLDTKHQTGLQTEKTSNCPSH